MSQEEIQLLCDRYGAQIIETLIGPHLSHLFVHMPIADGIPLPGSCLADCTDLLNQVSVDSSQEDIESLISRGVDHRRLELYSEIIRRIKVVPSFASTILIDIWVNGETWQNWIQCQPRPDTPNRTQEFVELLRPVENFLSHTLQPFAGDVEYTLYHGCKFSAEWYRPHSWTLDQETAEFFAERYSSYEILEATMSGDEIVERASFYTNKRKEKELFFIEPPTPS